MGLMAKSIPVWFYFFSLSILLTEFNIYSFSCILQNLTFLLQEIEKQLQSRAKSELLARGPELMDMFNKVIFCPRLVHKENIQISFLDEVVVK